MTRLLTAAALTVTALWLAGCDSGRQDPPNVSVVAIHADPTVGQATFTRVRANATPLDYKQSQSFSFDVDTYTFNFDISAPDGTIANTVSTVHTLEEGNSYTILLVNSQGNSSITVVDTPARSGSGTQLQLLHAAATVGTVDVYVGLTGFDVLAATPWGTVSNGDVLAPKLFDAGEYEFAVTEAGNPSNVLLRSAPTAFGGSENVFLFVADTNGESLAPFTLSLGQGPGSDFVDVNIESGIRVLNAIGDRSTIDAGIDLELAPPLLPAIPFGTVTDPGIVSPGDHTLTITPAGNPGVIEVDEAFALTRGALGTALISGDPGSVSALFVNDDFRTLAGEGKLRVFDASPLNGSVDVFILPPGTAPAAANVAFSIGNASATDNRRLLAGDYELTIRTAGGSTVLAGPTPITIADGGYYAILLADPAGGGSGIDVQFLYDFN